jgi:hypothetical protein
VTKPVSFETQEGHLMIKARTLVLAVGTLLASALPFAAANAAAPAGVAGTLSGSYGQIDCEGCENGDAWNVGGQLAFGFGGAFGAQLDGSYTSLDETDLFGFAGSLFWAPAFGRAGVNVSWQTTDFDVSSITIDVNGLTYGAFGEFYLGQFLTIGAKAGGMNVDFDDGVVSDSQSGSYIGAALTGYITPNFALQGDAMFSGVSDFLGTAEDFDNTTFGISAEFLVSQMVPISIFGGFTFGNIEFAGGELDTDKWIVGARFYFGNAGPALVDRHRNGTLGWIGQTEATSFILP